MRRSGSSLVRHVISDRMAMAAVFAILGLVLLSLAGPHFLGLDPVANDLANRYAPPSMEHWFGTDALGRDVFIRVLYGLRISLLIAVCAVGVGLSVGLLAALVSGYYGGWIYMVTSRLIDAQLSIPFLLLVLTLMAMLGASLVNVIIVLGLTTWLSYARVVTPEVRRLRREPFVLAAETIGVSSIRILWRNVLPNVIGVAIPIAALEIGGVIISASTLDFFGVGVPPPTPTLGGMIAEGRLVVTTAWWNTVFPGLALTALVASFSLIGDSVSRYMNPRERQIQRLALLRRRSQRQPSPTDEAAA